MPSDATAERHRIPAWWPWAGLALLLAGTVATLMYQGRGGGFYYDDWNFVLQRRAWNTGAILMPHNEHLSAVPVLAYKLLFVTVGLDSYWAYRLVLVLVHAGTLTAMFLYARPRVGPALALLAPASVAIFGAASIDLLWAFQLGYAASLLFGVLAFLAFDRRTRRGDVLACALVCASLGSSSVGLCVLVAAVVEVVAARRRWWILAVPIVLYAGWWLKYHAAGQRVTLDNVLAITQFTSQGAAATLGALFGLTVDWGRFLALGGIALLVWRARSATGVPWRLLALLAVPLSFWVLAAVARAESVGADTPRYLYPPAIFLLLAAVESGAGARVRQGAIALLACVVVAAGLTNLTQLRAGGRDLAATAVKLYGTLGAMEVAGDRIDPAYLPAPALSPQITDGPYLQAVRQLGPIVGGEAGVVRSQEVTREFADAVMQQGLGVGLVATTDPGQGAVPTVDASATATTTADAHCVRATPQGTGVLAVTVPDTGLVITGGADTKVGYRLWGDAFVNPVATTGTTAPQLLRVRDDGARAAWHAQLTFTTPLRVCGAG